MRVNQELMSDLKRVLYKQSLSSKLASCGMHDMVQPVELTTIKTGFFLCLEAGFYADRLMTFSLQIIVLAESL